MFIYVNSYLYTSVKVNKQFKYLWKWNATKIFKDLKEAEETRFADSYHYNTIITLLYLSIAILYP